MGKGTAFSIKHKWSSGSKILNFDTPLIMGILNITPDSFYDGGRYYDPDKSFAQVSRMVNEGADIIDIGAVSTRPGADPVSEEAERSRIKPVIEEIREKFPDIIISIDTYRSSIAEWAVASGASMINDISGGKFDYKMLNTVAELNVPYIMMHIQGTPGNMQVNPVYEDVVAEIFSFFKSQISRLEQLDFSKIIIDPGFGFGKTVDNNYTLLKHLNYFKKPGYPVMVGLSRKSIINKVLNTTPDTALNGTTVLNTIALLNGADILRVHDVKEAKEIINIITKYKEQY